VILGVAESKQKRSRDQVTGTNKVFVLENHWYEQMAGTKVRFVHMHGWCHETISTNNLLVLKYCLYQEIVGANA
jgi:hypothetical protein